MAGASQSREVLMMETNQSASTVSFGKQNGCYLSRAAILLLAVLFLAATIATGLLVYYYAPNVRKDESANLSSASVGGVGHPNVVATAKTTPITEIATTTETVTEKPEKKINVRLPTSLTPVNYVVYLRPILGGKFTIFGSVEIEMKVNNSTNNVTLHMADIITKNETIKLVPKDDMDGPGIRIKRHEYDSKREFYIAHLDLPLQVGQTYFLYMEFEGLLNDQLIGFYRSSYTNKNGDKVWLAATQFQPTDARRAFPCFDEPAVKATFEIYLGHMNNLTAISNMPRVRTFPVEGHPGWVWDQFEKTVPMSTYLIAFVISDFSHKNSSSGDEVLFRVWAREDAMPQAEYARRKGPEILIFLEEYFNISFPLPKQDMVAIPDFSAGAMENWGLITYRETALLYDAAISSASNLQSICIIIAHELAHQWFGNLVTPEWWTDLWLNEGFASYVEYLGTDHAEPTWKMLEQFVVIDTQDVFGIDCLESSHPISIPVGHPDEINEIFDRISYSKGAAIIRMMNHFLSEATFRKALTNYLNYHKYGSAEQDDLWKFLTDRAHEDKTLPQDMMVKEVMDTWTLQMGYPVITVTRNSDGTAMLKQERFLLVKSENSTDTHDYKWWVPITYTSQSSPNFSKTKAMKWMSTSDKEIVLSGLPPKNQWVIFNLQQTGYYRVNYDQENWDALIFQLQHSHEAINVINRAQIIDDALDLARAGHLTYDTALSVISYLSSEAEYVPWKSALNNLDYLETMFTRTSAYGSFKKYTLSILLPLYNGMGFEDNLNDPHLVQEKRVIAIKMVCKMEHPDCLTNSVSLFNQWMANPSNYSIISPNLKSVVYCTAVAEGGEKEWSFAWDRYLDTNVATEKVELLSAMGCSKKVWILSRYLKMAFTHGSGIRKQDSFRVFASVALNDVGRDIAWNYLRDQWVSITEYYGSGLFGITRIIKYATKSFNTKLKLQELEQFQSDYKSQLTSATRAVEQAVEGTKNNIAWMGVNYEVIVKWMEDQGFTSKLPNKKE